jgi:hypothetical protein
MSGYESPRPESEIDNPMGADGTSGDGTSGDEMGAGAMGAGGAEAPDTMAPDGGDATGGGSPGNPDDMGAENSPTPDDEAHLQDLP